MNCDPRSSLRLLAHVVVAVLAVVETSELPAAPSDVVRDDWYFRESLAAIDDWETLLARLDADKSTTPLASILPVPVDGRPIRWPNPVPQRLLPAADREQQLNLRSVAGRLELQRPGRSGDAPWETAKPDQEIVAYVHPGGGGKDQWYHRYDRRFDRLLRFRAKPALWSIECTAPLDLRLGRNAVSVRVHNGADRPLDLTGRLDFHRPAESVWGSSQPIVVPAGETQTVTFPLILTTPGGGLATIRLSAGEDAFCIPWLTHVEHVGAVLRSIEQILEETPDPAAAGQFDAMRQTATTMQGGAGDGWPALFEDACRLRDALLLRRIGFDTLLFVKRRPYFSEQPFMDAHHLFNRPGGGIYRLSPVRPDGQVTAVLDSLGEGVYRDVVLHWDADRLLFAFGNGSDKWDGGQSYDLFEIRVDGSGLRRLTSGPYNDCEPFYLPDGRLGFTSDRSEHFVMCGGDRHSPTLFVAEADGSSVRQLSFNMFNDFNPTLLPDGRILYSRWEYNERSVTSLHNPFTMNPDGTMVAPYYGNATSRPNVVMFPRPVPGSHKVLALFTAHHGQTHGTLGLIDVRRGVDGLEPLQILTPQVPLLGEKTEDSRGGWFSDPQPLSETAYLCSYTPTVLPWLERSWALYVGDRQGNLALVYRDPEISCAEPVPLVVRPRPPVRPAAPPDTGATDAEATLAVVDVYENLIGVPRGAAKFLRVLEDVPRKSVPRGGVVLTSGSPIFTIKRILGTVPIDADGSAQFVVPANRNVYFEVLDAEQREIQRMRSVVCLKPGERRTCIGCHESRLTAPPNRALSALRRAPSRPQPPPWGTQVMSFLRDVQPVLNARCVRCHTHDRLANGVILTDDLTNQFSVAYEELLPYLNLASAFRWDHPDDVNPRPPYTYGSRVSRLMRLLDADHHGVELSDEERLRLVNWVDANGVYYDRYESDAYGPQRQIFPAGVRRTLDDVYTRRCAACHGAGDGRQDTWWLTVNRREVTKSRALVAPLGQSAGGWQRCGDPVFADTRDSDYTKLLAALTDLQQRLGQRPREDLLSIAGTEAEQQRVESPPPPAPRPPSTAGAPEGPWVSVSNLPWLSASAGWTPNGDGLPRRDRDVQNRPLRLERRVYRQGLGTHAPSEIVYDLAGQYDRFAALVGGAEDRGTVVFQVFGDDRLLFDSGMLTGLHGTKPIDLGVAGVKRLRLVVTDAGDGYISDMANWADARLHKPADAPAAGPK